MNRIDRLVSIVILLQSKRIIRAKDIADHFNITVRTVYRDLKALDEAGVPIAAEAGIGYSLVEGYHLPPVMFTTEEANALFIGGEFVEHLTDKSMNRHVKSALLKIRSVLPPETQDYLEQLRESTAIFIRSRLPKEDLSDDLLTTIQEAIVDKQVLSIDYYAEYRDSHTTRDVEPLGLIYYGNYWHLIAYCKLRQDYRDFRADRITSIAKTIKRFLAREDFSITDYVKRFNRFDDPKEVKVKFTKRSARYVQDRNYYGFVEEEILDDGVLMTFLVPRIEFIAGWLLFHGASVEVMYPEILRQLLLEEAQKIVELYPKL